MWYTHTPTLLMTKGNCNFFSCNQAAGILMMTGYHSGWSDQACLGQRWNSLCPVHMRSSQHKSWLWLWMPFRQRTPRSHIPAKPSSHYVKVSWLNSIRYNFWRCEGFSIHHQLQCKDSSSCSCGDGCRAPSLFSLFVRCCCCCCS